MLDGLKWIAAIALIGLVAACGGSDDDAPPPGTVVEAAQRDGRFTILVEAISAAGLTQTLSGAGPFTVFAPTDSAFGALLSELGVTKAQLLADKPLLTSVLTYHVLPTLVRSSQVPVGKAITTVQGGIFKIDVSGSRLEVTDGRNRRASIIATDIPAGNGVIHVIDKVLLPADKNIVQTAQANPDFSILVEAVVAADLANALSAPGPLTVFAPTNAAFAALLTELGITQSQLLADKALLTKVLTYHVVDARVLKADVPLNAPISTLQGDTFSVSPALAITDQRSRTANIVTTDRVILPRP